MNASREILSVLQKRADPWYIQVFKLLGLLLALALVGLALLESLKHVVGLIIMLLAILLLCSCLALGVTSEVINRTTQLDTGHTEIETLVLSRPVNLKLLQLDGSAVYIFENEVRRVGLEAVWTISHLISEPLPIELLGSLPAPADDFISRSSKRNENNAVSFLYKTHC